MSNKTLIWLGLFLGSGFGSYIPVLFGSDLLSGWSVFGSLIGGILGIWAGYKLADYWSI